jgi:hypothetical protein
MKTIPSDYKDRCLTIADIPKRSPESLSKIKVRINYDGETNGLHAEALDHYVLPLFELAPKLLEIVANDLPDRLNRFTPEENELFMKLADIPKYAIGVETEKGIDTRWGPSLSWTLASAQHHWKGDCLFKITTGKSEIIARSDGSKWLPELR